MTTRWLGAGALLLLIAPVAAAAQESPVSVQGALGTNLNGGGNSASLSLGIAAGRRVDFLISAERNHLPTVVSQLDRGYSATRGGTTTFVSAEMRFVPLTFGRVSPYVLVGGGRGKSRPNVNDIFPNPVENDASMFFAGGGVRVPLSNHVSVFADVRFVMENDAGELGAFQPVRAGVAWRF